MGWCGVVRRHHHSPTLAMQPAGQDPEARPVLGTRSQYRSVQVRMPVFSG